MRLSHCTQHKSNGRSSPASMTRSTRRSIHFIYQTRAFFTWNNLSKSICSSRLAAPGRHPTSVGSSSRSSSSSSSSCFENEEEDEEEEAKMTVAVSQLGNRSSQHYYASRVPHSFRHLEANKHAKRSTRRRTKAAILLDTRCGIWLQLSTFTHRQTNEMMKWNKVQTKCHRHRVGILFSTVRYFIIRFILVPSLPSK